MSSLVAINKELAEQYLDKVVRVNEEVHAVLLCILDNGYYTSVGYAGQLYVADTAENKIVIYNAAAALNLPMTWIGMKARKVWIVATDDGFTVKVTEEKFDIKSVDFKTCKDIWNREQFKTIDLPSIYTLSDGSCMNVIALDL